MQWSKEQTLEKESVCSILKAERSDRKGAAFKRPDAIFYKSKNEYPKALDQPKRWTGKYM